MKIKLKYLRILIKYKKDWLESSRKYLKLHSIIVFTWLKVVLKVIGYTLYYTPIFFLFVVKEKI